MFFSVWRMYFLSALGEKFIRRHKFLYLIHFYSFLFGSIELISAPHSTIKAF